MLNNETSMSTGDSRGTDVASGQNQNGSADQQPITTAPELTEEVAKTDAKVTDRGQLPAQEATINKEQQPESASDSAQTKKPTSANIIRRNRQNAKRSTGPRNTQRTRHNALRH